MKSKILIIISFLLFVSCKKNQSEPLNSWTKISSKVQFTEDKQFFKLKSGKFDYTFDKAKIPFRRVVMLNASLVGYVVELHEEQKIVGVAGKEYIYSDKIRQLIQNNLIEDVGSDQKYNVEKILALKPDVIFTNYISSFENTYDVLRKNGIQLVFLDEYLEQKPLEKAAYLKIFGKLLGTEQKAEQKFSEIEKNYHSLKEKTKTAKENPKVLVNEMYGNQWFMAGGNTFVAHYLRDAGAKYILAEDHSDRSVPMSFEEVLAKSQNTPFWVNAGNYKTKKELLRINPSYEKISAFRQGNIYSINARQKGNANDYFESGTVRADWVLKDYILIFHPELLPHEELTYMRLLK
ncbi:MAG: ABC transporter substrate-binding protein [Cloacibacterium sp.]|nr:ABC transporter substrate-binding protein [Cloacibacterium sp.]